MNYIDYIINVIYIIWGKPYNGWQQTVGLLRPKPTASRPRLPGASDGTREPRMVAPTRGD